MRLETVPVPEIGPGELLVRVDACGLCPTDIKKIDLELIEAPAVLGHETAGEVVAAGKGAAGFLGRRVAVYHHVPCRSCPLCGLGVYSSCPEYKKTGTTAGFSPAGGGWAQYVKVSSWIVNGGGVIELPDSMPLHTAILMEPLNTCLKCIRSLPEPRGKLVILGQGPAGLMLTALARREGWRVLAVEPRPERRDKSMRFGAEAVLPPEEELARKLREAAGPPGPDAAIDTTESEQAINATLEAIRPGATMTLFAHTRKGQALRIDAGQVGVMEKRLAGSYSSSIDLNSRVMEILLGQSSLWDEFVTHVFSLTEINQALAVARRPEGASLKVAVAPHAAPGEVPGAGRSR